MRQNQPAPCSLPPPAPLTGYGEKGKSHVKMAASTEHLLPGAVVVARSPKDPVPPPTILPLPPPFANLFLPHPTSPPNQMNATAYNQAAVFEAALDQLC